MADTITNGLGLEFNMSIVRIIAPRDFVRLRYDDELIFFGHGSEDAWCAYTGKYDDDGLLLCAKPSDKYYFAVIKNIADTNDCNISMYQDFVDVCRRTGKLVDSQLVDYIGALADKYCEDADVIYNMFMHVYYGMIAEENKAHVHLGKSIKLLGLHDLLIKGKPVNECADCNRGSDWRKIYMDCRMSGINYLARKE